MDVGDEHNPGIFRVHFYSYRRRSPLTQCNSHLSGLVDYPKQSLVRLLIESVQGKIKSRCSQREVLKPPLLFPTMTRRGIPEPV